MREFSDPFICRERSSPSHFGKISFGGFLLAVFFWRRFSASLSGSLGVFENQDAAVVQMDFGCLPCLALVDSIQVGIGWIPGKVEPVEVGFVVGNPLVDGDWQLVMPPHRSKNPASNLAMTYGNGGSSTSVRSTPFTALPAFVPHLATPFRSLRYLLL